VPYSSAEFAIVDLLVEDLDGTGGQEILFLANDIAQRPAPSLIVGMKPNGELSTWYWHFGRLRKVEFFGDVSRWGQPSIIVLGENPLVGDEGYATVIFALSGEKLFSEESSCWNLMSTMVSTKGAMADESWEQIRDKDVAFELGCGASSAGPLAWYRWIEPSDVTVTEMDIGWVTYVVARSPLGVYKTEEHRLITLDLGNGFVFRIPHDGKWFELVRMDGAEREVIPTLAP